MAEESCADLRALRSAARGTAPAQLTIRYPVLGRAGSPRCSTASSPELRNAAPDMFTAAWRTVQDNAALEATIRDALVRQRNVRRQTVNKKGEVLGAGLVQPHVRAQRGVAVPGGSLDVPRSRPEHVFRGAGSERIRNVAPPARRRAACAAA